MKFRISYDIKLSDIHGEDIRIGVDSASVSAVQALAKKLSTDQQAQLATAVSDAWGKALTLGIVCMESLVAAYENERELSGEERIKRYNLARRISKGATSFEPDERDLMKKVVQLRYPGSLVYPQVCELLEGADRVVEVKSA